MAKNKLSEENDLIASCEEEDEMMMYRKCSLNVVTFRIVHDEKDLEMTHKKTNSFKPDMAHQIFGATEMIFGYRQLSITLYYLHNSAKCCVDVQSSDKIIDNDTCKADDIMESLNPWLPENYKVDKKEFRKEIAEEDHTVMFGEVIKSYESEKNKSYKITVCNSKDPGFKEFHQRFETFIVWFIDGANYIDLEDERWIIFYVYEERLDVETNTVFRSPIGFCTVYKFFLYPNSIRPRISQFFILPTHQNHGIGTKVYATIYNYLKNLPDAADITVEEPTPKFQKIRDFCDSLYIYRQLNEHKININTQSHKQICEFLQKQKICKRQAQRVCDILECLATQRRGHREYARFTETIKTRIHNDVERETRGSKRLCNLERVGVVTNHIDKKAAVDAEYGKYIDSLEKPVNRLKLHLATNQS